MNQFMNKPEITSTPAPRASLRNRLSRAALAFLGLFILVFTATLPAKAAGCNGLGGRDNVVKYPMPENDRAIGPGDDRGSLAYYLHYLQQRAFRCVIERMAQRWNGDRKR